MPAALKDLLASCVKEKKAVFDLSPARFRLTLKDLPWKLNTDIKTLGLLKNLLLKNPALLKVRHLPSEAVRLDHPRDFYFLTKKVRVLLKVFQKPLFDIDYVW